MGNIKLLALVITLFLSMLYISSEAQQVFELNSSNSTLVVKGTSSLHDWEMEATKFQTSTTLEIENNQVKEIQRITFTAPVEELSSDKWIMDKNAHEALKEKEHPNIRFSLKSEKQFENSNSTATVTGILTIAGKSSEVQLSCTYNFISAQQLIVNGSTPLKMTDFGIDPPTAMMGTLKTMDDITVEFELEFTLDSKSSAKALP
jgi:polyisoprenoid-binding protein YceI